MKKTLGMMIAELRKEKGMTQLELAEKMGVTDKAVSKWERDLSCPDINSLPNLAEILGVTVDELMQIKREAENPKQTPKEIVQIVLKAVPIAMGVAVVVLSVLDELPVQSGFIMLGIGMFCAGISLLNEKK
ncbi:MAG: helix-turn-helix transcriptional regulator [Agathobacter sp.]|nr:helix-turn-helix transcriptional regulator [Agathobacter sp.]